MSDNPQRHNVADADQTVERLKQGLPPILAGRPVSLAYAFGSVVEGCPTPFSDVDIALVLQPGSGLSAFQQLSLEIEIELEMADQLGIREADVRTIDSAPIRIQGQILTKGILLYSRDDDFRVAYETSVRKRYWDWQPVMAMMREAYFARQQTEAAEEACD